MPSRRDLEELGRLAGRPGLSYTVRDDLIEALRQQIKDEAEAFDTYNRLATIAERLLERPAGGYRAAQQLRDIAQEEAHHKSTLSTIVVELRGPW